MTTLQQIVTTIACWELFKQAFAAIAYHIRRRRRWLAEQNKPAPLTLRQQYELEFMREVQKDIGDGREYVR